MPKYSIYGIVRGSKYLGDVEAETEQDALDKAWEELDMGVSLCYACSSNCEDPEVDDLSAELIED